MPSLVPRPSATKTTCMNVIVYGCVTTGEMESLCCIKAIFYSALPLGSFGVFNPATSNEWKSSAFCLCVSLL